MVSSQEQRKEEERLQLDEQDFQNVETVGDKGNEAYYIFFLLGTGFLLPWNAFITAIDYFAVLYPTQHVDTVFSVCYMVPNLALLVLLVVYLGRTPPRTRISAGFFAYFLLIILVPVLDLATVGSNGLGTTISFALTVIAVALSGAVDALIQGSLFGMAAELPPMYTQALAAGVSASGLVTSGLRILTKLLLPGTESGLRWSAYLYFLVSSAVLLCCVWAYQKLVSLPWIRQNQARRSFTALTGDTAPFEPESLAAGAQERALSSDSTSGSSMPQQAAIGLAASGSGDSAGSAGDSEVKAEGGLNQRAGEVEGRAPEGLMGIISKWFYLDALVAEGKAMSVHALPPGHHFEVLGTIWPYAASVTIVYFVTLSIFPGFISELKADFLGSWYPVLLMASFNLFDFMGKMTPTVFIIENDGLLFALVIGRLLFYPLYSACLGNSNTALATNIFIPILTSVLGFSNGLLTSLLMMAAPAVVQEDQAEAAGTIMVLFLVVGLTCGAVGAYFWITFHL